MVPHGREEHLGPSADLFRARIYFGCGSILGADLYWAPIYFGRGSVLGADLFWARIYFGLGSILGAVSAHADGEGRGAGTPRGKVSVGRVLRSSDRPRVLGVRYRSEIYFFKKNALDRDHEVDEPVCHLASNRWLPGPWRRKYCRTHTPHPQCARMKRRIIDLGIQFLFFPST